MTRAFTKFSKSKKVLTIVGMIALLLFIGYQLIALITFNPNRVAKLGMTYSKQYASFLGLDWKTTFTALLEELNIKYWRIPTFWEEVELERGTYDFTDVEWQLEQVKKHGGQAVLVLGWRQPRWPECHQPDWVKSLSAEDRKKEILKLITATVNHFKNDSTIEAWQVENEPLLNVFGECPNADLELLQEEVQLVRILDSRPILVTASGELALWHNEAKLTDILGSTMYRSSWNKYFGYVGYWLVPFSSYRVKAWLFGHRDINTFWVVELQTEPWVASGDITTTSLEEQYKTMSPEKLLNNVNYAQRANVGRVYLWGAEWWYYTKTKLGTNDIWDVVKKLPW